MNKKQMKHPEHLFNILWSWLNEEIWRLLTFTKYPKNASKSAILLAHNGFAYLGCDSGKDDTVICFFCKSVKRNWQPSDDILEAHKQLCDMCPMVNNQRCNNISFEAHRQSSHFLICAKTYGSGSAGNEGQQSGSEISIVTDQRPKRTEYTVSTKRLQTFVEWPEDHHLRPQELADAGFYYAGYGDCARCFYCGGGLRNWEDEDDVWVEHARWFPKCAFIREKMGQMFVDTVQELYRTNDHVTLSSVLNKLGHATLASYLGESAAGNDRPTNYREPDQLATTILIELEPVQESLQPPPRGPIPELGEIELNADDENATANIDTVFGLTSPLTIDEPRYLSIDQRQESFYETSFTGNQPKKLAHAGFYYEGYSTAVKCAFCAGSLWLINDVEKIYFWHAKHFPHCGYIRFILGDELVNSIDAGERLEGPILPDIMHNDREEDVRDIPARRRCRCCSRRRNSILHMPCGHLLLCEDCGICATVCYRCQTQVLRFKYIPRIPTG